MHLALHGSCILLREKARDLTGRTLRNAFGKRKVPTHMCTWLNSSASSKSFSFRFFSCAELQFGELSMGRLPFGVSLSSEMMMSLVRPSPSAA